MDFKLGLELGLEGLDLGLDLSDDLVDHHQDRLRDIRIGRLDAFFLDIIHLILLRNGVVENNLSVVEKTSFPFIPTHV